MSIYRAYQLQCCNFTQCDSEEISSRRSAHLATLEFFTVNGAYKIDGHLIIIFASTFNHLPGLTLFTNSFQHFINVGIANFQHRAFNFYLIESLQFEFRINLKSRCKFNTVF